MLEVMQKLALCFLWQEMQAEQKITVDLKDWFNKKHDKEIFNFFTYLVEPAGKAEKYYALKADPDDEDTAILEGAEIASLSGDIAKHLPFNKPSGPNSAQLGPVLKRGYDNKKGASPQPSTLTKTMKYFSEIVKNKEVWSSYFQEVHSVWSRKSVRFGGEVHTCQKNQTALHLAIQLIPDKNAFLVFEDSKGKLPGHIESYCSYLLTMIEAEQKYTTKKAPSRKGICSLCQKDNIVYPAGCSQASVNIANMDWVGFFPGFNLDNAYLSYATCAKCTDLLYVFKFHVLDFYIAPIAGSKALVLPDLDLNMKRIEVFIQYFAAYMKGLSQKEDKEKALKIEKKKLLKALIKNDVILTIDIIWGKFGQKLEDISGQITGILPSRLREIHELGQQFEKIKNPFFPHYKMEEFEFDVNLGFLYPLFRRPGGKKAKTANANQNLFQLKQSIVEAIYKRQFISQQRFWQEIMVTANWYFRDLLSSKEVGFDLLQEGYSDKKNQKWWTIVGWIKHLTMALEYFRYMEVIKKLENKRTYTPTSELLKPYFRENSGINTNQKSFAFILGILYGKVIEIQGIRKVNVSANSLTWLKRLTLSGKDLPDFFIKVREKLLAYEAEKRSAVREIIKELARLGCLLGDDIELEQTKCCYFLLLGQAMSKDVFASKDSNASNE